MDIVLAKTFLTIIEVGNFRIASEKLHVTQSTVSARIKSLEEQLGKQLFVRNKSGATLTQAGLNFQEFALSFIQLWEKAQNKVSSEDVYKDHVSIGARPGLWEPVLMKWLPWAKSEFPEIAYRIEFGIAADLIRKLEEGIIDIAILLSAPTMPGIAVEELYLENFVLIKNPNTPLNSNLFDETFEKSYIEVDWGKEFQSSKNHYFPTPFVPHLSVSVGTYGVKYIIENGGCGYFPYSMISEHLEDGSLVIVEEAPKIKQPVYLAYSKSDLRKFVKPLLAGVKSITKEL